MIWNDNTVSLMIDRVALFSRRAIGSLDWYFAAGTNPGIIAGVLDFQGTPPFVVYFDDVSSGTVSYWNCDGWGTDCPFGGSPMQAPKAPSNLRIGLAATVLLGALLVGPGTLKRRRRR